MGNADCLFDSENLKKILEKLKLIERKKK